MGLVNNGKDLPAPAAPPSQLFADKFSYVGGTIIAEGSAEKPVRFETNAGKLTALRIELDTIGQTVEATGSVQLEREVQTQRQELRPKGLPKRRNLETTRETLEGQNLHYDFKNQTGQIDNAHLQLASLSISTESLMINGRRYSASNVLLRPGGLSEAERKIYGTPPFNIRAKSIVAVVGKSPTGGTTAESVAVKGGGLYFRNTRLLPVPAYVFRAGLNSGGGGEDRAFQLTPGISFNSADRVLVTTRLTYPLSPDPKRLLGFVDLGLSQRIGLRGGVGVQSETGLGQLVLRERRSDIVETQLTNRIELDRKPELLYRSPSFLTFGLPGDRQAGFSFDATYGSYGERTIGTDQKTTQASRLSGRLVFTTRLRPVDGPFLRLFAGTARYGGIETRYRNRGFEVGYEGNLLHRVRGQLSYRSTSLSGDTPFRFDRVEIARELRSTFDVQLTPRYLLPVDLRYDLSRRAFRDKTFGVLRSYKTFAYGVVYQTVRHDLRLEVRQGF